MTEISKEAMLAAIRECVTVVQPGEVLAVRLDAETEPRDLDWLAGQAKEAGDDLGIRILFLPGEEFARLIPDSPQTSK